ncbi:hypothetical protein HPB48_017910 [Haemaphysalis longicornis]|uniref:Uncharacterized protein n=1 Tax=Haemaphysalis longicornis TaxID=44386 RepID=A0A9J6GR51_HAELO|nr:hypothetical protein HPB48_017910 [Haemaphysalis longicornis]
MHLQSKKELALALQPSGDLAKHFLQITAWDKDSGKPDEYLGEQSRKVWTQSRPIPTLFCAHHLAAGGIELGLHCKRDQLQHWTDVVRFPDQRFERWHPLVDVPLVP